MRMNFRLALWLLLPPLVGCTASRVEESRLMATDLQEGELVVIMGRTSYSEHETEERFVDCVAGALSSGSAPLALMSEQEFKDLLYPWFEPRTAPDSVETLSGLFTRPGVADQVAATRVRYLAWIEGSTTTKDKGGSLSCAVSTVGGGCFGLTYWEEDASYEASIWDMKQLEAVGQISADATGTSYVAGLVVPIPIIARSRHTACQALSGQLRDFVMGENDS